jgi:low affinity Fe/Cu permease
MRPRGGSAKSLSFSEIAHRVATAMGNMWAFFIATGVVVVWGVSGPIFGFSDTWQLVINTGTTIVTFLMVFLIQNTQNRDSRAIHLKLDELLKATSAARKQMIDLENCTDEELESLERQFHAVRKRIDRQPLASEQMSDPARHADARTTERRLVQTA